MISESPVTGGVDDVAREIMELAAKRLRAVLPSFTDPRHYASHADIDLVRRLEDAASLSDERLAQAEAKVRDEATQIEARGGSGRAQAHNHAVGYGMRLAASRFRAALSGDAAPRTDGEA